MAMSEKKPKMDLSRVTDFEVQLLIVERDVSQFRVERITALLDVIGSQRGYVDTAKKEGSTDVSEESFNALSWEPGKSGKGPYETARLPQNNNPQFQSCLNILKQNITTTAHTFSEKSWVHYYWLSEDGNAIFRRMKKIEKSERGP